MSSEPIQPYGAFQELAPDLFVLDGEWYDTPFARRMTVVRLPGKKLVVHNAIRLRDDDYAKLDALGVVAAIVVPNLMHDSDAHFYSARYPAAAVYAPQGARKKLEKRGVKVAGVLAKDWPAEWQREIDCRLIEGTRLLEEFVFFHRSSRTLIVTDLVFNMQNDVQGFEKKFWVWNRIYRRFGPSRIFRFLFAARKDVVLESVRGILADWDFDRVVMNHGEVLPTGGHALMKRGFEETFHTVVK